MRRTKYSREALSDTAGARGLGWASIGIGLAELAAPRQVQHMLGLEDKAHHRGVLRTMGVRELMHGLSILAEDRPNKALAAGVWSRVAGDALDTALLGVAATRTKRPGSFMAVSAVVMAIGVLDLIYAKRVTQHAASH